MKDHAEESRRRGQTLVLFAAVMVPVLFAMLALTADAGLLMNTRARLQNAADAAALAGAQVLMSQRAAGLAESEARAAALAEARTFQQANCEGAGIEVEFGIWDGGGSFMEAPLTTAADTIRATVFRSDDAPGGPVVLFFAPVWGVDGCDATSAATAQVSSSISAVLGGLGPFGVPQQALVPPGDEMVFYPSDGADYDDIADTTTAPGCFGLLDFDGGEAGTPELIDWILNGYPGTVGAPPGQDHVWINGASGFRAALKDAMASRIGDTMIMGIYDQVEGQGTNATFRVTGFVLATIMEVQLTGSDPHITGRVNQVTNLHGLTVGGSTTSPNIRKIQLID